MRLGTHVWWTLAELAQQSGLSRWTVWNLVRTHQLPAKNICGKLHVRQDRWERWCGEEDHALRRRHTAA